MIIVDFLLIVAFAVVYISSTSIMAFLLMTFKGDKDNEDFFPMAWFSGLLVFLTAVFYIMTKL